MFKKESRTKIREKKHMKVRNRFSGTAERPRLAVFRSNEHMYAQIIDDTVGTHWLLHQRLRRMLRQNLNIQILLKLLPILEL